VLYTLKKNPAQADTLSIAKSYIERGWAVVPLKPGRKSPETDEWQKLVITLDNVHTHFRANSNVGVQLGPKSGGLVDVDLDCDEARILAPHFQPPTNAIFGRAGSPSSHYLYVATDPEPGSPATIRFTDEEPRSSCAMASTMGRRQYSPDQRMKIPASRSNG
jgi:hypothetical protein